tara:strand:- start:1303 stop:2205 length:903 start_codon:yes stop_codon:yes gene_type:complete
MNLGLKMIIINKKNMKILILGSNGMFANELINELADSDWQIFGTTRKIINPKSNTTKNLNLLGGVDFNNLESVFNAIDKVKPCIVLNLVGITKYKEKTSSNIEFIEVNSLAPHKISKFCNSIGSRFIQLSTDCVFSGIKGGYMDRDSTDPIDLYGKTKALGEIAEFDNTLTIRTSFIGHNSHSSDGLLEWFLGNKDKSCNGFKTAIYSGVTTCELASIFTRFIFPNNDLSGIYNISSNKISKYDLLVLIADIYKKDINIIPSEGWVIDRSLNSEQFKAVTGYNSPSWKEMILEMYRKKNV